MEKKESKTSKKDSYLTEEGKTIELSFEEFVAYPYNAKLKKINKTKGE